MPTSCVRRLVAACLALMLAASVHAQAGGACPDGFTGPCCSSASPNLPALPAVSWPDAKQTCWIDCGPFPSVLGPLSLSAPTPAGPCGVYDATLSGPLVSCPAPLGSRIRLTYTRHWQQAFPAVGNVLVYRFVAVGNICVAPHPAWTCGVEGPPATPFVFGFVDYAYRKVGPAPCNLIFRAAALALGHPCDRFAHDGACPFSANPGSLHPLNQYTLVAPGTNFTPSGTLVPPQGPASNVAREGLRLLQPSAAGTCTVTERFATLQLTNVLQQCACVSATAPGGPFWRQSLRSTTTCNSTLDTSPLCPFNFTPPAMTAPFPTLVAWSIGRWGAGQFPGLPGQGNQFFLAQGGGTLLRPGNAVCPAGNAQRGAYYGVENRWDTAAGGGGKRVDLVDNVQSGAGTAATPVVGGPAQGTHVVFFY